MVVGAVYRQRSAQAALPHRCCCVSGLAHVQATPSCSAVSLSTSSDNSSRCHRHSFKVLHNTIKQQQQQHQQAMRMLRARHLVSLGGCWSVV